jgi:hypothetical protein
MKKPTGWVAGGLGVSDLFWPLRQALQVRRHGVSVMMVMDGMAVGLHLKSQRKRKHGVVSNVSGAKHRRDKPLQNVRRILFSSGRAGQSAAQLCAQAS